jgi:hypothetical protein
VFRRMAVAVSGLALAGGMALAGSGGTAGASGTNIDTVTPYVASVSMAATPDGNGYWVAGVDGGVFSFGDAQFYGSLPGDNIHVSDIVGIASTPDGRGYWLVGADGGLFSFGDAQFYGSLPGILGGAPAHPVTGFTPTPDGHGYWMVASDGGVFTFGDAHFYGSLPGQNLTPTAARIAQSETLFAYVGSSGLFIQATPDGLGYWIADSSGDVFTFGDAKFFGTLSEEVGSANARSASSGTLSSHDIATGHPTTVPITAFVATADGGGYMMAGTNGEVYTFGDAHEYGSLSSAGISVPPVTITGYTRPSTVDVNIPSSTVGDLIRTPDGGGYWMASLNGGVYSFGDAQFYGSVPGVHATIQTVGK